MVQLYLWEVDFLRRAKFLLIGQGLKRKQLFEQRDLNSTIDSRSIYASAMSTVFEVDFERIRKEVFWGEDLKNYSDKLFKT